MKAEITFEQVYFNKDLMNFFFREQAENTVDELLDRAKSRSNAFTLIDEYSELVYETLDELEELFYSEQVDDIAKLMGIELKEEE